MAPVCSETPNVISESLNYSDTGSLLQVPPVPPTPNTHVTPALADWTSLISEAPRKHVRDKAVTGTGETYQLAR